MYSRYSEQQPFIPMNNRLRRQEHEDHRAEHREERREERRRETLPAVGEGLRIAEKPKKPGFLNSGFLGGLLKNINFDSDDILLILIILFLSKESDDEELLITLGLMLFMGL